MIRKLFMPCLAAAAGLIVLAPWLINGAPVESTMGFVQKIFYFHVPSWMVMFLAAFVCGIASAVYLFSGRPGADRLASAAAEVVAVFGLIGLVTGPLWGRKAWGVWWQWDARLTLSLVVWLMFVGYLLLRRYGGSGANKLAAVLAMFATLNMPFVYWSVNVWRTVHPSTAVVTTLGPGMRTTFWWCAIGFITLGTLILAVRTRLETDQARLDDLYLKLED
ncbi:MAG TPA: cytochrome c biogenesis protein CcsA [Vicinamibacterales bacterium]|nr:cytochrome c biogenesis protein CcsA [Vicinamibacterales bacterium]